MRSVLLDARYQLKSADEGWLFTHSANENTIIILFTFHEGGGTCDRLIRESTSWHVAPACRK